MITRAVGVWAGKLTLAVRFGGRFARAQCVTPVLPHIVLSLRRASNRYATLVGGAYVALAVTAGISAHAAHSAGAERVATARAAVRWLLPLLSAPVARTQLRSVCVEKDGGALNEHVGGTAKLQLLFGVLLAVGTLVC